MKYYAGIGSRKTPPKVLALMHHIAGQLRDKGYRLRSGGAEGADTAFEWGACGTSDIYLPWAGFNGRICGIDRGTDVVLRSIAKRHHPNWSGLSEGVRKMHTRNAAQILGGLYNFKNEFVPQQSEFVICWTPDGKGGGGTGQALRVAATYGVPVYDLALESARDAVKALLA